LIKLSYDQRFHWSEPFAFARARAAVAPSGSKVPHVLLFATLLSVPLLLAEFPENAGDVAFIALFAIGGALLFAYLLVPLASRLPNDVLVTSDKIIVGREAITFLEIEHAIVGTMLLRDRTFPVLTFRTRAGQDYVFGLGRKVDPRELAGFLARVGIREPAV
jgi:hypothetical protein